MGYLQLLYLHRHYTEDKWTQVTHLCELPRKQLMNSAIRIAANESIHSIAFQISVFNICSSSTWLI